MKLFANPLFPSFCRGIDGLFHQILFVGLFAGCKTIFFFAKSYRLSCYEQVIKYVFVVLNYSILRKLYLVGNFVICRRVFLLVFYNIEFQYFKLLSFLFFFFFLISVLTARFIVLVDCSSEKMLQYPSIHNSLFYMLQVKYSY